MEDSEKELVKIEKYLRKHKDAEFIIELRRLSKDQLEERIKAQALFRQETITAKRDDKILNELKAKVKEFSGPYNDSLRLNDKISRFISLLINE